MSCPICKSPTKKEGPLDGRDANYYYCYRCGEYMLSRTVVAMIKQDMTQTQITNISGWIREHQKEMIGSIDYKKLLLIDTPTVDEKSRKLFNYLTNKYPIAGQKIDIDLHNLDQSIDAINKNEINPQVIHIIESSLPLLSICWAQNSSEVRYIVKDYLEKQKGFITFNGTPRITPDGWEFLEKQKYNIPNSQICFVAMWFDSSMNQLWEVLKSSILNAGYKPIRVDKHLHISRIDDEIISLIRQSKFIVADYTGQRAGVYFESGFALGLGINVFWLCDKEDSENLHFDTNHYNFIFWEKEKLNRLKDNLTTRIIAIQRKGSYNQNEL